MTAMHLMTVIGDSSRFEHPTALMAYLELTSIHPGERSATEGSQRREVHLLAEPWSVQLGSIFTLPKSLYLSRNVNSTAVHELCRSANEHNRTYISSTYP